MTFDAPTREFCTIRRASTNTPLQAAVLWNDELALLQDALTDFRARYEAAPDEAKLLIEVGESMPPAELDPRELAAWTLLANAVLNLDAVITRA